MTLVEMWCESNGKAFYCRRPTWKCCQALVTRVDANGDAWGVRFAGKSGQIMGMGCDGPASFVPAQRPAGTSRKRSVRCDSAEVP